MPRKLDTSTSSQYGHVKCPLSPSPTAGSRSSCHCQVSPTRQLRHPAPASSPIPPVVLIYSQVPVRKKKSPSQPTAPRTGTTPVHRRRAGRKLCRLTRDPAERPLAYDLRRLRAAAPQHHRRAATPPERGTACTLRRSCGASLQHRRRAATPPDCRLGQPAAQPER